MMMTTYHSYFSNGDVPGAADPTIMWGENDRLHEGGDAQDETAARLSYFVVWFLKEEVGHRSGRYWWGRCGECGPDFLF